jgi:peptidoglycan biosynthesis protein MviN/MurJ (putative lipid II flippase)
MSVTGVLDQFFAAGLGPGALSTLSYGNRLLSLILSMGAMAIGRATLPIFSEMQATSATKSDVNALALKWAIWVFAAGTVVMAIGWIASPYMVKILFERGAFTSNETAQVSTVLQWGLLQVPAYGFTLTLVNALASSRRYGIFILSGVVGIVVKLVALLTLLPLMQLNGLVLSAAAVYLATSILFAVAIKRS